MTIKASFVGAWAGTLLVASMAAPAPGADHRDSPRTSANTPGEGNLDINDVYLFRSPSTKSNTVIIVTLSPAAGIVGPSTFNPSAVYEVRVQNTPAVADNMVFQFTFSAPDRFGRQSVQVVEQMAIGQPLASQTGIAPPESIVQRVMAFGATGKTLPVKGGGRFTAGVFDDPFFFDLNAFNTFVSRARAGASLGDRVAPFLAPSIPNDFFGSFNVIALVLEVPTLSLQSGKGNTRFGVWARTIFEGQQFDRMGRPAVNTAAIGPGFKDAFNLGTPFTDRAEFTSAMVEDLTTLYGIDSSYAFTLSQALLPDILTYDASKNQGFLNGRKLADDVIDAEFGLLTAGKLTSDRVENDSTFRNSFPYLGVALPRPPLQ